MRVCVQKAKSHEGKFCEKLSEREWREKGKLKSSCGLASELIEFFGLQTWHPWLRIAEKGSEIVENHCERRN